MYFYDDGLKVMKLDFYLKPFSAWRSPWEVNVARNYAIFRNNFEIGHKL